MKFPTSEAVDLKTVLTAIIAALEVWKIIKLMDSYDNGNPDVSAYER